MTIIASEKVIIVEMMALIGLWKGSIIRDTIVTVTKRSILTILILLPVLILDL